MFRFNEIPWKCGRLRVRSHQQRASVDQNVLKIVFPLIKKKCFIKDPDSEASLITFNQRLTSSFNEATEICWVSSFHLPKYNLLFLKRWILTYKLALWLNSVLRQKKYQQYTAVLTLSAYYEFYHENWDQERQSIGLLAWLLDYWLVPFIKIKKKL